LQTLNQQNIAIIQRLLTETLGDSNQLQQRLDRLKPADNASAASRQEWQSIADDLNTLLQKLNPPAPETGAIELNVTLQQGIRIRERIDLFSVQQSQPTVVEPKVNLVPLTQLLETRLTELFADAERRWQGHINSLTKLIEAIKFTLTPEDRAAISDDAAAKARNRIARELTEIPEVADLGFTPTDAHVAYFSKGCHNMYLRPEPDLQAALKYLTTAVLLQPEDPVYRFHVAMVLKQMGRDSEAEKQVRAGVLLERQMYQFQRDRIGERLELAQGPIRLWLETARIRFLAVGALVP